MKRNLALVFAFLFITLLAACTLSVTGEVGLPEGLEISNATYETDTQAQVDGETQYVICNDRTTNFTYAFTFDGDLNRWRSYLKGVETNRIAGDVILSLTDDRVAYNRSTGRVVVNYKILPGAAPQAIVVNPKVAGKSRLFLEFGNFTYPLLSDPVPILQSCS